MSTKDYFVEVQRVGRWTWMGTIYDNRTGLPWAVGTTFGTTRDRCVNKGRRRIRRIDTRNSRIGERERYPADLASGVEHARAWAAKRARLRAVIVSGVFWTCLAGTVIGTGVAVAVAR